METKEGKMIVYKFILKVGVDFNIDDTTDHWDLLLPGHGGYLTNFFGRVKTAFSGVTTPEVKVGDPNILDSIIRSQRIDTAGVLIPGGSKDVQFGCAKMDTVICDLVAPKIRVTITSSSGNLSALTAGELEFTAVYAI